MKRITKSTLGAKGLLASVALAIGLAGCSLSPPQRSPYGGADTVGAVQPSMLIGDWNVRVLNPVEGEEGQTIQVRYREDGTMEMTSDSNREGMQMSLLMRGRWSIQGETVLQELDSVEETSGNAMAALMTPILNANRDKATGNANVFEASANRVVMVSVEQGQAQELTRQ